MSDNEKIRPFSRSKRTIQTFNKSSMSALMRIKSQKAIATAATEFNASTDQNEEQLLAQIELAKKTIIAYQHELLHSPSDGQSSSRKSESFMDILHKRQQIINKKDQEINVISEEIRFLRSAPDQARKEAAQKYKTFKESRLFKLAGEVLDQKNQLIALQAKHLQKKQKLENARHKLGIFIPKYYNTCHLVGKKPLEFSQFRILRKQQKNILTKNEKNKLRKKQSFHRQTIDNDGISSAKNSGNTIQSLKDITLKKQMVESTLKKFRKKHNNEMAQLYGKVDFLKEQNEYLQQKLRERKLELQKAGKRFKDSKILGEGMSSGQKRKLEL